MVVVESPSGATKPENAALTGIKMMMKIIVRLGVKTLIVIIDETIAEGSPINRLTSPIMIMIPKVRHQFPLTRFQLRLRLPAALSPSRIIAGNATAKRVGT